MTAPRAGGNKKRKPKLPIPVRLACLRLAVDIGDPGTAEALILRARQLEAYLTETRPSK